MEHPLRIAGRNCGSGVSASASRRCMLANVRPFSLFIGACDRRLHLSFDRDRVHISSAHQQTRNLSLALAASMMRARPTGLTRVEASQSWTASGIAPSSRACDSASAPTSPMSVSPSCRMAKPRERPEPHRDARCDGQRRGRLSGERRCGAVAHRHVEHELLGRLVVHHLLLKHLKLLPSDLYARHYDS